jgi:hypothetical protein
MPFRIESALVVRGRKMFPIPRNMRIISRVKTTPEIRRMLVKRRIML